MNNALFVLTTLVIIGYFLLYSFEPEPRFLSWSRDQRQQYIRSRRKKVYAWLILSIITIGLAMVKINTG